jgi:uncharacterized membrane protein (UPF0127 family)
MRTFCMALVLLSLLLAGCAGGSSGSGLTSTAQSSETTGAGTQTASSAPELRIVTIDASSGEKVKVRVEIADNALGQVIGLMYRKSLPKDRGMLFVYTDEEKRSFWMKNTFIPLSVAFMDSQGRIVDIQNMKPVGEEQSVPDAKLPRYVSAEPAQYALEVNQGFFEEHGVKVGDKAKLPV